MTTLVICDCGRVQEYDENLSLKCQHCEVEVTLLAILFDEDTLSVRLLGQEKGEALVGEIVFLLGFGEIGFVPFFKAEVFQFAFAQVGGDLLLEHLGPQGEAIDLCLEVKGQVVEKALAGVLQFLLVGDDDGFVALGGDWIHSGLEDITLGPFQQTGINNAP